MNLSPRQLQIVVTTALVIVLATILAGYIYIGMYYAKEQNPQVVDDAATTTPSRRDQILEALQDVPPVDNEKRQEVLNSLASSTISVDGERRQKVLEALTPATASE